MEKQNSFFVKQFIWSYLLIAIGLIIACFLMCLSSYSNCIFAFLIYLPFPALLILFTKLIVDIVMHASKKQIKKGWVIVLSIFLYIFKYIFAVIPILIGILINISTSIEIFNLISLVIVVLIYPSSSLLSQLNFKGKQK